MDRLILIYIILAQISSDIGKNIDDEVLLWYVCKHTKSMKYNLRNGYKNKDLYIFKAITLINKNKKSNFRYYISKGDIADSFIIYFNFKVNGKRMQVSFHSFCSSWETWATQKTYMTFWDHKSSRRALYAAADAYKLNPRR